MKLSEFELEVMQLFWEQPESTAPELHKHILKTRQVTYSTVKTIIDRLEEKQAIKRIKTYGRTIVYGPAIQKEELYKPLLRDFVKRVFSGNSRPLLNHLLEDDLLSKQDMEYLQSVIENKKREEK